MARTLSEAGRKMIQDFEGLSLKAYPDPPSSDPDVPPKNWSIGYGHAGAQPGQVITKLDADILFASDIAKYEEAVNRGTPLTNQNQFDALVSFAYNVGIGVENSNPAKGFLGSTLRKLHNAGNYSGAADEFPKWRNAGGQVSPTLVKRRALERSVYLGEVSPLSNVLPSFVPFSEPQVPEAPLSRNNTVLLVVALGLGSLALWKLMGR